MKNTLTKKEKELLPFSIFLMAIELAIRFLDDYLRGDVYFRVHNDDDNLTRARTQLILAKDIYNNLDKNIITPDVAEKAKNMFNALGIGKIEDVSDIIYLKRDTFDVLRTREMAQTLREWNTRFQNPVHR